MRFLFAYFILPVAIVFSQSVKATINDTPCVLFSRSDYQAARELFLESQKEFRLPTDNKAAVELHEGIISGFDVEVTHSIDTINAKVGRAQLTAAHIAAMMGDTIALKWLFENGADFNARDIRSFTPAHFAALQPTKDSLNYLEAVGAELNIRNNQDGTPHQIWEMTHLKNPSHQSIPFFMDDTRQVEEENGDNFCVLTLTTFIEGIKQMPVDVLHNWRRDDKMAEPEALQALTASLKKARPTPGAFYLKRTKSIQPGELWKADDYGLFAGKNFTRGEVVGFYAGIWQNGKKEMSQGASGFDTTKFRGYLPFATQGFPNIEIFPFANKLGLRDGSFAVAIRPIPKNEPIVWHAHASGAKTDIVVEEDPDTIDAFLLNHPLTQILEIFKNDSSLHPYEIRNRAIILYLARNPCVFIRLLAEQKITIAHMRRIHTFGFLGIAYVDENGHQHPAAGHIFLDNIERQFVSPLVREFFSKKARKGHVQILLMMIHSMANASLGSLEAIESMWKQVHVNYCSVSENRKMSPQACAAEL